MKPQLSKYASNFFFAVAVGAGALIFTGNQSEWPFVVVLAAISLAKLFAIITEQAITIEEQENEIKVLKAKLENYEPIKN